MIVFRSVPYRRWRRTGYEGWKSHELVVTRQYERVMKLVGAAIKSGRHVNFETRIVYDGKGRYHGQPYDVIDCTIGD